jgi:hypothetical protein
MVGKGNCWKRATINRSNDLIMLSIDTTRAFSTRNKKPTDDQMFFEMLKIKKVQQLSNMA